MPTSSQLACSAGAAAGQSAGFQHAHVEPSSEQAQVESPIVQSPRPGEHVEPFSGSAAGHTCAARGQFHAAVSPSDSHVHELAPYLQL
jgi:hypothetical protein